MLLHCGFGLETINFSFNCMGVWQVMQSMRGIRIRVDVHLC